jgi:hypothetical protein
MTMHDAAAASHDADAVRLPKACVSTHYHLAAAIGFIIFHTFVRSYRAAHHRKTCETGSKVVLCPAVPHWAPSPVCMHVRAEMSTCAWMCISASQHTHVEAWCVRGEGPSGHGGRLAIVCGAQTHDRQHHAADRATAKATTQGGSVAAARGHSIQLTRAPNFYCTRGLR